MHIWDRKTLDGRFQVPETFLGDDGDDLGGRSTGTVGFLYHHQSSGLGHRGENGLLIQRYQRSWINDLDAHPFFGQRFRKTASGWRFSLRF